MSASGRCSEGASSRSARYIFDVTVLLRNGGSEGKVEQGWGPVAFTDSLASQSLVTWTLALPGRDRDFEACWLRGLGTGMLDNKMPPASVLVTDLAFGERG